MANTFTPEQIAQILEEFFNTVGTRQYIGARYVPIFGRKDEDSIEWDNEGAYEPLTIVLYQGNSYTSRQYVPVGVEITNQEFWALTGNYNAQVEQYRRETAAAMEAAQTAQESAEAARRSAGAAQEAIDTLLPKADFDAENTVSARIAAAENTVSARIAAVENAVSARIAAVENSSYKSHPISLYKLDSESDYTQAWARIMELDNPSIDVDVAISGTFVIDKVGVEVSGNGKVLSPIVIDVKTKIAEPDDVRIHNLTFDTDDEPCIDIVACNGAIIDGCFFKTDAATPCINCVTTPKYTQQAKQLKVSNNHFYGGYGVYVQPVSGVPSPGSAFLWPMADVHIVNNTMNNLIKNVHIATCDGAVIANNTMFLSQGGANKLQNVYLDMISYCIVSNNQLFEAGAEGIYCGSNNHGVFNGNNIVWCGQYQLASGIRFVGGNTGADVNVANNVIGNSIEAPSKHGIETASAKKYTLYSGNNIFSAGSSDHWKASESHPSDSYYGIMDESNGCSMLANQTLGGSGNKTTGPQDMHLNVGALNTLDISNNLLRQIASPNPKTIASASDIAYTQRTQMFIINSAVSMTKSEFAAGFSGYSQPVFGFVLTYSGTLKINDAVVVPAQSSKMFVIYGNDVRWL